MIVSKQLCYLYKKCSDMNNSLNGRENKLYQHRSREIV